MSSCAIVVNGIGEVLVIIPIVPMPPGVLTTKNGVNSL